MSLFSIGKKQAAGEMQTVHITHKRIYNYMFNWQAPVIKRALQTTYRYIFMDIKDVVACMVVL